MDFGKSDDPRVQAQLDRLGALSVPQGRLGLETITALMERLGNPHRKLPPVFHVAGTNGKGSVCAFLRAMLEADGKRVHVTTSPHLVRYNERIRIAGKLIEDEPLADLLEEVLDAGEDLAPSFFEVTIAAAFLAFSRTPADACVVEVGLGGRFDATNVLEPEALAACGIAALGIDHERFLLAPEDGVPTEPMARIAFEKAGIAKQGVPLVTWGQDTYSDEAVQAIKEQAERAEATLCDEGRAWHFGISNRQSGTAPPWFSINSHYSTDTLPAPCIAGDHQYENCAVAVAMIRWQSKVEVSLKAKRAGAEQARWQARMQRLGGGPLVGEREVWLDGGHNWDAGLAISKAFEGQELHLVVGMIESKQPAAIVGPLVGRLRSLNVVSVPNHDSHGVELFGEGAVERADLMDALLNLPDDGFPILIAGSLYLAGEALRLNDEIPD